jgi:serine/threonine-protein kinase
MHEEHPTAARLSEIFNEAKVRPAGAERAQFLTEACGGDATLQADVEQLLRAFEDASRFLKPGPGISPDLEAQFAALKPEEAGEQIGHYKLQQQIGEGGFGVVWMAEQTAPVRRRVALKIIKLGMDTREVIARFEQERQALAMMDHPNIARVLDAGATATGRPYFVMELVRGIKITEYCDQANLATAERLQLFIAVCHAVQHAHQKGIIHRDLKPSNILVTLHDGVPVPKVIDFGVAKATQSQRLTELTLFTQFQQMIGTPLYMSPEQAEMSGLDIDTRSDIYSLGVLLYELLVGRTPFDPEKLLRAGHDEIRRVIREEDPPKPSTALSTMQLEMQTNVARHRDAKAATIAGLLRGDLDWIVMKALEKDRARRYETAGAFAADVQRYLTDEPVTASPPSTLYRLRKFARRNKVGLAVAAVVLFSLVLAGSGVGWALRDRAARHAQAAGQVTSILTEIGQLESKQNWTEALVAARHAEAVASGSAVDAATTHRVRERLKDLEFVDRLEKIRMKWWARWIEGKFDSAGADREYARAFRDYGVDVETPIEPFKDRPPFAIPIAAALDVWADARWSVTGDAAASKRLIALARRIDPEPLRDRLRATWGESASGVRDEVRRLAESIDISAQHPATLVILASALHRVKLPNSALKLLHRGQSEYPADFWLNYNLAYRLEEQKDYEGAIRFYTAAVSTRPTAVAALNNLGNVLKEQGKPDEAMDAYRKGIGWDPQAAFCYNGLGNVLDAQGKRDEAIVAYRKAAELDPKEAAHHANLGTVLRKQKKLDEAVAEYGKAVRLDPKDANAQYGLGTALFDLDKLDAAIVCFRKTIELDPKHADAHDNLGRILYLNNKLSEATIACRKAIELKPNNAEAHRTLGITLAEQNQFDEAATALHRSIELEPKRAIGYFYIGNLLAKQNKMEEAIVAYRTAIELEPKSGLPFNNLGNALRAQGRHDEATAAYRRAIEFDPKNADAYLNLGTGLTDQKKLDEAVDAYRKAIELNPKHEASYNNLGVTLKVQGKVDEAIAAYRKAIELNPTSADAYYNLGIVLRSQKRLDEAVAAYRKAIELEPGDSDISRNLGALLHEQGKIGEANAAFRDAVENNPNDASAYRNLGAFLCCTLKDHGGAVSWLRKAIELNSKDAQAYVSLGCALSHDGKVREAIAEYEKGLAVDPDLAGAHNDLAWLFATCADPTLRDPARAVDLAKKAAELEPENGKMFNTLGAACYRSGDWNSARVALEKSMELRGGGDSYDWFLLAMAHWHLGNKEDALRWHHQAVEWMETHELPEEDLRRFRAEAGVLLGVKTKN